MTESKNESGSKLETTSEAPAPAGPDHDEWVMDESIEESFPASDAPSTTRPGSRLSKLNQTVPDNAAKGRGSQK